MKPYIIIIAGIPASGKTMYARHIANELYIPSVEKDNIKEKLYEIIEFDQSKREISKLYGMASYSMLFHFAECLMKAGVSFVLESNFTPVSADFLLPLVQKYGYRALTVLFDADMQVLHKRVRERDITDERHPGIRFSDNLFNDFNSFNNAFLFCRDFCVGEKITINTTDFSKVDYKCIDSDVRKFIES